MKKIINIFAVVSVAAASLMALNYNSNNHENEAYGDQDQPQKPASSQYDEENDIIVMFTKDACSYCQYMKPIMQQVERKYGKVIRFIYADIVQHPQYPSEYGFSTIPQIAYYKKGKKLLMHGSKDRTVTADEVEENIKTLGMGQKRESRP